MTQPWPETRDTLLLRLQNSADQQAWGEFVHLYQPLIVRFAIRQGLQDADASDIAQRVLWTVARAAEGFQVGRQHGSFRGWLAKITTGMQVARGLAAAHTQGLVHRDVKPANVLLAKGTERAIITDFGLARAADDATLTRIGLLAGTPHYMSPEQARGEAVDQKSDLFSLGSLLFAMITGKPPIASELGSETIQQIARGQVPSLNSQNVNAPAWFSKFVDSLHRPQDASDLDAGGLSPSHENPKAK